VVVAHEAQEFMLVFEVFLTSDEGLSLFGPRLPGNPVIKVPLQDLPVNPKIFDVLVPQRVMHQDFLGRDPNVPQNHIKPFFLKKFI
jgi:hypothetical protein